MCLYFCLLVVVVVVVVVIVVVAVVVFIFSYLFKPSNCIITIIMTIMFINITVMSVLEKSSGGEFQARNSSGMVFPYLSR